jgi:hypothetical protein
MKNRRLQAATQTANSILLQQGGTFEPLPVGAQFLLL